MNRRWLGAALVTALPLCVTVLLTTGCGGGSDPEAPAEPRSSPPVSERTSGVSEAPALDTVDRDDDAVRKSEPRETRESAQNAPSSIPAAAESVARNDAPTPAQPIVKTIPSGTTLDLIVENGASSETSQPGQPVRARVAADLVLDGHAVVPEGSILEGTVAEAVPQKKIGGTAKLVVVFTTLRTSTGPAVPVSATFLQEGKSQTKKDAATIGGSAAGGALLGKLIGGGSKDAAIGAVVGAAAGTAVAAKNKADSVELASGTRITVALAHPAEVVLR